MEGRWQYLFAVLALAVAVGVLAWRLSAPKTSMRTRDSRPPSARVSSAAGSEAPSTLPTRVSQLPKAEEQTSPSRMHVRTLTPPSSPSADETTVPAGRATLVVTVLDRRTDKPVEGLRLEGSRWESPESLAGSDPPRSLARLGTNARADAPGVLALSPIPAPSHVWLRLGARGYESNDVGPIELPGDGAVVRQVYFLSPRASVTGRVVLKETRAPIAGARVWMAPAEDMPASRINTATTGSDGRFDIPDVPAGRRYLAVRAPFPAPEQILDVSVLPGQRHDVGDIEVSERGAVVRGRVVRGHSAQPVTSATVEIIAQPPADRDIQRAQTDGQGRFVFEGLANGPYTLSLPDFLYSRPLLLAPEEERELVVHLGEVTLRGRLLSSGKPIAGSLALTRGPHGMGPARTAFVGDDGRFELAGLEPGRWTVMLWGHKAAFASEIIDIPDKSIVERDFVLATGSIVGRVVEQSGLPVPNARVECAYQPEHPYASFMTPRVLRARSAEDGTFELGPLPEGTFCVRGEHPTEGYGFSPPVAVPRSGPSAPVEIHLQRHRGAMLRSVALSFETGAPIREAFLVLYDEAGRVARSASRNDAGVAEVRGLAPGTYRIEVSASGYTADVRTLTLRDGEERTVESVLATAGALRVWVETSDGVAIEGASLLLEPLDAESLEARREGKSELGGLWVVRGLAVGRYRLTVDFPGGHRKTYPLSIRSREVTEIHARP